MSWYRELPVERLRNMVRLDAASGSMTWMPRVLADFAGAINPQQAMATWNTRFSGQPAFAHSAGNGYLHGSLLGRKVLAHRVVWALHYGTWPVQTIDHIDGDRTNNRPENLRDVPHQTNCQNQPLSSASSTGVTGVSFDRQRGQFEAHVTVDGAKRSLGRFKELADAEVARAAANATHGFHVNHGRKTA